MDFFRKLLARIAALWAGWSARQRIIVGVIAAVILVTVIMLFRISATPVMVSVIDYPISDEAALNRIVLRLNQENVKVNVSAGYVQVADEATARRMRTILIGEDLIPSGVDPWAVFDRERWTITDFERNVNFRRAQQTMIEEHIKAMEDIDAVGIQIVWPERQLFRTDQNPVSVSVRITPKPGSDITISPQNRKKIEGIQKLLQFAVEGLQPENIVITDHTGLVLNDFEGLAAADRLALINQEQKQIRSYEEYYRKSILNSLQQIFSNDRVRDLNIKIDMDMSKKSVDTTEFFPITMKPQTPGLSYDDSILLESIIRSSSVSETSWRGTGFMPEGPTGVEGQVTPAFRDMDNLYGEVSQNTRTSNQEVNQRSIQEERSPQIDRITVSANIDGTWKMIYNEKGEPSVMPNNTIEREYIPVSAEVLRYAEDLIRGAIGYNSARGDSVIVTSIPVDRTAEFKAEDDAYFRQKHIQTTIIVFVIGLTLLLFGFMLFRMISREMERRKRLAEEERARREQMLRESAMAEAESEGMDVSISMEERTRMELMENAINLAKEHPQDAAQLIRTWLLEE